MPEVFAGRSALPAPVPPRSRCVPWVSDAGCGECFEVGRAEVAPSCGLQLLECGPIPQAPPVPLR